MIQFLNNLLSIRNLRIRKISTKPRIIELWNMASPYDTHLKLIRIGSEGDGGYIVPELPKIPDLVISPGVGDKIDFELHFAHQGIKCILIDGTINELPKQVQNFEFIAKNIGVSRDKEHITLQDIAKLYKYKNAILQMDIEGYEFDAFKLLDDTELQRYSIIVLEIHGISRILDPDVGYMQLKELLSKLTRNHLVIHAHPNNIGGSFKCYGTSFPNIVELTLVRKDYVQTYKRKHAANLQLDVPNSKSLKQVGFPIFLNT